ncbi:MAG: CDP-alcohol phosphatidyltransferase family protein [Patescibacteria group bacterium]
MIESQTAARAVANTLPVVRAVAGPVIAKYIRETPADERSWAMGAAVATLSITDKLDGTLAARAGPTKVGGWLDQMADKAFVIPAQVALQSTGEMPTVHPVLKVARDVSLSGLRWWAASSGKDVSAGRQGKQKTTAEMMTLTAAASPLATKRDLVRAGASVATAMSLTSFLEYLTEYTKKDTKPNDEATARNGMARQIFAKPINAAVDIIDHKLPQVTPDHITMLGEQLVKSSVIIAALKPENSALPTALYSFGSMLDALDGSLARKKGQDSGGTTVEGMLKDVKADKRQEITTFLALSIIARRRGNNVAANNYAIATATTALSALFRAEAETSGQIVAEGGIGTRVGRGVLGGVGLGLNRHQDASDIISAAVATGNVNTVIERRHVAKNGSSSPYSKGENTDPTFREHAEIRRKALLPLAVSGAALGALALVYKGGAKR